MRFVSIFELTGEHTLARPVLADNGSILLNKGARLSEGKIARLQMLGFPGVYVVDNELDLVGDSQEEIVSTKTRQKALGEINSIFEDLQRGKGLEVKDIQDSVESIISQVTSKPDVLTTLQDVRSHDGYTFHHSVNVCVISVYLGVRYGLQARDLFDLGVGAILHDIGKIAIPDTILKKAGPLELNEVIIVQKHPVYTWQLLRQHPDVSLQSALVGYQHHEKLDGSGYPQGLCEGEICPLALIAAVADIYDAVISERVYKPPLAPHAALRLIRRMRGTKLSEEVVKLLVDHVSV